MYRLINALETKKQYCVINAGRQYEHHGNMKSYGVDCKYIYIHIDLSRMKQCPANYTGDGPPKGTSTITRRMRQLQGFQLNGIILAKRRSNANCIVEAISNEVLSTRVNNLLNIGDIVVEINDINISSMDIFDITEMIAMQPLHSIVIGHSGILHQVSQSNVSQSNLDVSENQTIQNDELRIRKLRINCPFKVICVNKSIVQLKTGKTVNVGDIVTEINNINITALSNIEVAELLSSVQLHSIINHSPLEWEHNIRSNRRNNNAYNTLNIEHTNRDSVIKLNLQWDYENLCPYCQFLFLKIEKKEIFVVIMEYFWVIHQFFQN